jgi:hypothetical protein
MQALLFLCSSANWVKKSKGILLIVASFSSIKLDGLIFYVKAIAPEEMWGELFF